MICSDRNWKRLEAAGISTGSVGWPALRPGADWAGVHLDETFAEPNGKTAADWALPLSCASSDAREDPAAAGASDSNHHGSHAGLRAGIASDRSIKADAAPCFHGLLGAAAEAGPVSNRSENLLLIMLLHARRHSGDRHQRLSHLIEQLSGVLLFPQRHGEKFHDCRLV
jgi:hypothetical protein